MLISRTHVLHHAFALARVGSRSEGWVEGGYGRGTLGGGIEDARDKERVRWEV